MDKDLLVGIRDETWERDIYLAQERRLHGMYIIGKNGMGKSRTMLSMIIQDLEAGRGLGLIDPHGDLITDVLGYIPESRQDDVTLWDARDPEHIPGFDIFAGMHGCSVIQRSEELNRIVAAFMKVAPSTNAHRMENLLRLITIAFLDTPGYTLAEMPLLIGNESFRRFLAGNVKDQGVRDDWERLARMTERQWEEYTESSMTRIRKFTTDPLVRLIVGQQGQAINFREAMDTGKIILIKMPRDEEIANLLGTLIVDRLLAAALSRDDTPMKDRRMFCVYVDEFARFQTDDFAKFFTDGRKYAVPTTVAHQARWQLGTNDQAPRAAHNWLLFKLEYEDAAILTRGLPPVYWEDEEKFDNESWNREQDEREEKEREQKAKPAPPPVQLLNRKGHTDPELAIASQEAVELYISLVRRFSTEIDAVFKESSDPLRVAARKTLEERMAQAWHTCTDILSAIATGDKQAAWSVEFLKLRSLLNDREVSASLLASEECRDYLKSIGEDAPKTGAMIAQFLKIVEHFAKHYSKQFEVEEEEEEIEDEEDEEGTAGEYIQMTQKQITNRLTNLRQFRFLFRLVDDDGETIALWLKTQQPHQPTNETPIIPTGKPPEVIESEITARQARFRGGTPPPDTLADGPPIPPWRS